MKHFATAMLAFGMMLAAVSVARADNTPCTSTLSNMMIDGNLVVPDSASCALDQVDVTGNVLVGHDATFNAVSGVTISGNLLADHCTSVSLQPSLVLSSVAGNVEIQHCTGSTDFSGFFAARIVAATIGGNFDCHNNFAPCLADTVSIMGNAEVSHNSGGTSIVRHNTIGGNLQCVGNTAVTDSILGINPIPNTVAGKKLGQCTPL
jgi:hypothetical protein